MHFPRCGWTDPMNGCCHRRAREFWKRVHLARGYAAFALCRQHANQVSSLGDADLWEQISRQEWEVYRVMES